MPILATALTVDHEGDSGYLSADLVVVPLGIFFGPAFLVSLVFAP